MGGEHYVSFHKEGAYCDSTHEYRNNQREVTISGSDLVIWEKIKPEILQFMENVLSKHNGDERLTNYVEKVRNFQSPEDIKLYWHYRDDDSTIGYVLHDISKIFMLAFPGKICGYFDRCSIYQDFEGMDYEDCIVSYWYYDKIPRFELYKPSTELKPLLMRPSSEIFDYLKDAIEIYQMLLTKRFSCDSLYKLEDLVYKIKCQRDAITRLFGYIKNILGLNPETLDIAAEYLRTQ